MVWPVGRRGDLLLGGLNDQIEHHLFPNMPRPALRHAQPLVCSYCSDRSPNTPGFDWPHLAALLAWGVIGAAVATRRFRWDPRPQ
jgi:hypothetical protein